MNEAEKVFYDDVREKKQIAQNAFKKKGGLNTAKAPFNNYTKPQADKKNGDISTFNLNRPMDWASFKMMPVDLQRKYLLILTDNGGAAALIADMFGVSAETVTACKRRLDIPPRRGFKGDPERFEAWKRESSGEDILPTEEKPEETGKILTDSFWERVSGEITVTGTLQEVYRHLVNLVGESRKTFTITFKEAEHEA